MSNLRLHNLHRVEWWLNRQYPDRIAGRMPPDTVLESRKLEGNVLLKAGAFDRVDDYYMLKSGRDPLGAPLSEREKDWLERRYDTDVFLLYMTDQYLRERAEDESLGAARARWQLMHRASREILLNQYEAGGYVYLERLERLGKNNHTIRTAAGFARAVIDEILDECERRSFRLEVEEDKKSRDKYQAMVQDRPSVLDAHDSYRRLAAERDALCASAGLGVEEATQQVAKDRGVSERKVWRACRFVKEEEGEHELDPA